MQEIKGVIFDLGRVLVDVDLNKGLMKNWNSNGGLSDIELMEELFNDFIFLEYQRGKKSPVDFFQHITSFLKNSIDYDEFVYQWTNIFAKNETMERIYYLIREKYPTGLLSDIDRLHWQYLRQNYKILQTFDRPVLSYEIGQVKPHPLCYQKAANSLNLPPENCLFIDDRSKNVDGAKAVGMQSIQFQNACQLVNELSVFGIELNP